MKTKGLVLCIGFVAAVLVPFASASAQSHWDPMALKPGDRVKVDLALPEAQAVEGLFQGIRGDSVLILLRAGSEVAPIPVNHIQRIRVHLGKTRRTRVGFGMGLGLGVLLGGAIGLASGDDPSLFGGDDPFLFSAKEKAGIGAILGGLVGGVIGALVGHRMWTERWVEAAVPSVRPTLLFAPNGHLGFGLTIPVGR